MRILLLNASPHKGNTWKLARLLRDALLRADPTIQFTQLHLAEQQLPFCTGCSRCFRLGHEHCPHVAHTQPILDAIAQANGVIVCATAYQMHVPAICKNFTDHLCFLLHRPRFFDKRALAVSTIGGSPGAKGATKFLAGTLRGWGFNRCDQLAVRTCSWNDYVPTGAHLRRVETAARKFYAALSSDKLRPPRFGALIPFNLFRGMHEDYLPGTPYPTRDGAFWEESGMAHLRYAPDVPLPFYKKLFGSFFYHLAKKLSGKMQVTYRKAGE